MAKDKPLKSAFDLAMERLREQDREQGVGAATPLTREQKEGIARLRQEAEAKLAEIEILYRKNLTSGDADPAKRQEIEEHYRIDRRRIQSALESAIHRARGGD